MEKNLKRIPIYALAFLISPVIVGTLLTFSTVSQVMIQKALQPLPSSSPLPADALTKPVAAPGPAYRPAASTQNQGKPMRALFVLSNQGTQITDFLGTYEIFGQSGLFELATVAQKQILSPLTGQLALTPNYSLSEAPEADVLVIPSVLVPSDPELVAFVKERAPKAKLVLSQGEEYRILAQTGLLKDRSVTSHFMALPALKAQFPDARWLDGTRYVKDGNLITSAGLAASLDAALFAIENLSDTATAEGVAKRLSIPWRKVQADPNAPSKPAKKMVLNDFIQLVLHAGYGWEKPELGILIYPAISELAIASALDVFPRTFSARTTTLGAERKEFLSQFGLKLVPSQSIADAPHLDFLLIPSGKAGTNDPVQTDSTLQQWIKDQGIQVTDFHSDPAGKAFERDLKFVTEQLNRDEPGAALHGKIPSLTRFVAKMIEYPIEPEHSPFPASNLWWRPFLVGILGMFIVFMFDRRLSRGRIHSDASRSTKNTGS